MVDKGLLADWIRHAANDLIAARHLFEDLYPRQMEIAAFHSQQCAEIEIYCEGLNPYGAITRYPNELIIDEAIVTAVIERAQKIYDFCIAKINLVLKG